MGEACEKPGNGEQFWMEVHCPEMGKQFGVDKCQI